MKKNFTVILITLLYGYSIGQNAVKLIPDGESRNVTKVLLDENYNCSTNSIFSQPILDSQTGYFSDEATNYNGQIVYENFYGLTEDIGGISFWGTMFDGAADCYAGGSLDFEISFYQDNAGAVGTLVQPPFTVNITPIETGDLFFGAQILRFDTDIPSTSLTDGWVSVVRLNPSDEACAFSWLSTTNGDDIIAFSNSNNGITVFSDNVAFCLTSPPPDVPLSNWAIIVSMLFIAVFMFVGYRRRLFA